VLTIYGVTVLTFLMVMYALDVATAVSAWPLLWTVRSPVAMVFASGNWPFGVVEPVWCVIALHRFYRTPAAGTPYQP
jgi:hypothetical protein